MGPTFRTLKNNLLVVKCDVTRFKFAARARLAIISSEFSLRLAAMFRAGQTCLCVQVGCNPSLGQAPLLNETI